MSKKFSYKKLLLLYCSSLFCYFFTPTFDLDHSSNYYTVEDEQHNMKVGHKDLFNLNQFQKIETIAEAEEKGYLIKNPTYDQLIRAVDENSMIPYDKKDYFYRYITTIYEQDPFTDCSILLKNIELLEGVYSVPKEELKAIFGLTNTMGIFRATDHSIILNEYYKNYHQYILNHEFNHMRRTLLYRDPENNTNIQVIFNYPDGVGFSLDEELNAYYTSLSFIEFGGYPYQNIYLLKQILTEEELYNTYFFGNIDTLKARLKKIDSSIDTDQFVSYCDKQVDYLLDKDTSNNHDIDYELYSMYIDYFFSKEKNENYEHFSQDFDTFYNTIYFDISTPKEIKKQLLEDLEIEKIKILQKRK